MPRVLHAPAPHLQTYGSSSPLAEFQLEANRTFLGMLDTYREAVVAQVRGACLLKPALPP